MENTHKDYPVNPNINLSTPEELVKKLRGQWPIKNTAILVAHGIGNQKPLETIDVFARGFINALVTYGGHARDVTMTHQLVAKKAGDESYYWFDNFIRIKHKDHATHIDIYEYYWANRTEDKTSLSKCINWLRKVTLGARHFYKNNKQLSTNVKDKSVFISEDNGFNFYRYFFIIYLIGSVGILYSLFMKGVLALIRIFPMGQYLADLFQKFLEGSASDTANVIGDIAIYNEVNPRSELNCIRKEILNGAVKAIRYLIEPVDEFGEKLAYERVVVAGHSLGSQVSFDALNRITHQVNLGEMSGYDKEGYRINSNKQKILHEGQHIHISHVLDRFYTFGSPLDKIAFFLREQSEKDEYIRTQMLENFHCFKQRNWNLDNGIHYEISTTIVRQFDSIIWRNYFHKRDYVSGSLDYYHGLTNVQCNFSNNLFKFTHSNYWYSSEFFGELLAGVM